MGGVEALMMRTQLSVPNNTLISGEHYNQLLTLHGTTMVFLFVVPMMAGFGNYFVPLMIGARDVAFPRLNALSFWLFLAGGLVFYGSIFWNAPEAGWITTVPLAESTYLPSGGVDAWIYLVHLTGLGSLIGAINFFATIANMRAPGMTWSRLPLFVWSILTYALILIVALPVIAGAVTMLLLDRHFGTHFFDPTQGGSVLLWQNLFWFFGHPEVYVMVLPAFGIFSEILPVFARKPIFGYKAIAASTILIAFLGLLTWIHHMFTTPLPIVVLIMAMISSFAIAVPTGVKIFNWIGTMWGGRIRFDPPMLYATAFIGIFMIGGLSGIMLALFPIDQYVTDSYFVVAHFHYVLGSVPVFAVLAGLHYWYPKFTGRMLDRSLAVRAFWVIFIGFNMTFFPMHAMGLTGMPRRIATYTNTGWDIYNNLSTIGSLILGVGILMVFWNCIRSMQDGSVVGNDPWEAATLEWYTTSPPPPHNFDDLPPIRSSRPVYDLHRQQQLQAAE